MDDANSPWGAGARVWVREVWSEKGSKYQAVYKGKCLRVFRVRQRAFEFVEACNKLFN
jgi:hypothetical protein